MEEQKVHPHITHFNDCGCLSARKDTEIADLQGDKRRLSEMLKLVLDGLDDMHTASAMTSAQRDAVEAAAEKFPEIKRAARELLAELGADASTKTTKG